MDGSGDGQALTKAEFFEAIGQLRNYIDERFQGLDERFQALKEYVDERTHDAETRLLRGFANFASTYECG